MLSLKVGHFDKVVCEMLYLALAVTVVSSIFAIAFFVVSYLDSSVKLALIGLTLTVLAVGAFGMYRWTDDASKDTGGTVAPAAVRDYDKAKLYFVTHYRDLKVLEFDTYQLLVRYKRQDPPRVCKASLIPYDGVFLPGDAEDCAELPQGG